MNTMLQTFECVELGTIRTTILDGQVWFVAKDIAIALGHQNPERAVRKFVEDEDKGGDRYGHSRRCTKSYGY